MTYFLRYLSFTLLLILSVFAATGGVTSPREQTLSGPVPNFNLPNQSGQMRHLDDFKGQVIMLNFWASWCAPCRKEMPMLNKLHSQYDAKGFTLLSINTDVQQTSAEAMLQKIPVDFEVLYDPRQQVSELFNIRAMPSSIFIDCKGQLVYLHQGYREGDDVLYANKIEALLKACPVEKLQ